MACIRTWEEPIDESHFDTFKHGNVLEVGVPGTATQFGDVFHKLVLIKMLARHAVVPPMKSDAHPLPGLDLFPEGFVLLRAVHLIFVGPLYEQLTSPFQRMEPSGIRPADSIHSIQWLRPSVRALMLSIV